MDIDDCPLPEVAEALRPFIRPREEVTNIRRGLQAHLQNQLRANGATVSSIDLASPGTVVLDTPSNSLSGVRKAYWRALKAHNAAQSKYDALRAEIDQLQRVKSIEEQ